MRAEPDTATRPHRDLAPAPRRLRDDRRFVVALAAVGVGALVVRVWWVLEGYSHYQVNGDALYYHLQAWTIADGKGFINPFDWYDQGKVVQIAANPPLYASYLAAVSKLGFWSVTDHRLASSLLGTGAVVAIGLVARQIGSNRAGIIAAAIAAVYPNLWINDGMLLAESMTALCMPLLLLAAYAFWREPVVKRAVWLGLALGLAALTRGEVLFLAPILMLPLLYGMHSLSIRERGKLLVVTALCMVALIAPWVAYNLSRYEEPVYMTDHWGTVLKAASCDDAWYGEYSGWYWFCQKVQPPGDYSQRDIILRDEALDYTRDNLGRLPVLMAIRVGRLWDVYNPSQTIRLNATLEGRTHDASVAAFWSYWILLPFAIAGLVVLKRRGVPITPIVAPAITVTIAAATTYGVLRYRVSFEPGFVVAAAIAMDAILRRIARGRAAPPVASTPPDSPQPPGAPERATSTEPVHVDG
ncbi:MAG: glycosyltransferase family 39 protein [Acidimicrobiia bacterium]